MGFKLKLKDGPLKKLKNRDININYDSRGSYGVGTFSIEALWGTVSGEFVEKQGELSIVFTEKPALVPELVIRAFVKQKLKNFLE
jgi:hypothetical protein